MNNLSLELLNKLTNPDAIVRSGYRSFPSYWHTLKPNVQGQFSAGYNEISIDPRKHSKLKRKDKENVLIHEGRHAGLRQLMRDYGTKGYNKGFAQKETFTPEQQRALQNRDLEKFAGLLGYRGNPNSDTLFNQGQYEKDDKGNWTYVLDDESLLAGVIPTGKKKKNKYAEVRDDDDFEHSIVYNLPRNLDIDTSKLNFETRVSPQNYRAIRALELYNKLLDLRKRKT